MSVNKFKIIFINYGPYAGCCGVHIHFLANALVELGYECKVFLLNTKNADHYFGKTNYAIHSAAEIAELPIDFFENSIIHAWTPRETVRVQIMTLRRRIKVPYIVHLEDNEVLIAGKELGTNILEEQKEMMRKNPELGHRFLYTHPLYFESFLQKSSGVTCIIKALEEFAPQGVPRMTFWPACEDIFFNIPLERNMQARQACEMGDDLHVIVYPGAIHSFNGPYFIELLLAVEQLHQQGFSLKIIRCGIEDYEYSDEIIKLYQKHVILMDDMPSKELPNLMGLADFLVQPGAPRSFDDYRFPSKAPFFLASGRPVILPNTNVAEKLRHGKDCFLLEKGDAQEIAKYLQILIEHPELAKSIGMQGRMKARDLFSWEKSAKLLIPFYEAAINKHNASKV